MSDANRLDHRIRSDHRPGTERGDTTVAGSDDERGERLAIGMYHRKAGTRDTGGVAMYVQELVDALADRGSAYLYTERGELTPKMRRTGAEVVQIDAGPENGSAGNPSEDVTNQNPGVLSVARRTLPPLFAGFRDGTIRHMNEHVDVLLTHDFLDDIVLSNLLDVPVIRVFHGFERTGIGTAAHELLSASGSVANSTQTATEFVENLGYEPDGVVYPGVDVERFSPAAAPAFERDEPTVLFVGRLIESKGVFDLVDAVSELDEDVHLSFVGRGEREALAERIERRGLEPSTTVEGPVPHEDLPRYYAAADVVCTPSHYESFGMVNLEAMACGTPVVTTNVPGITEYAVDGETAMLVPPNDPDAIADALSAVVASSELRTRLARGGRATAKRYSWEMSARNLLNVCCEIIDGSAP